MRAERHRGSQACILAFSRFWTSKLHRLEQGFAGEGFRSFSSEMAAFLQKCVSDTGFEGSGELPLDVLDKIEANHLRSFSARSPLVLRSFSAPSPLVLRSFSARSPLVLLPRQPPSTTCGPISALQRQLLFKSLAKSILSLFIFNI
jgi:hypothetical protein